MKNNRCIYSVLNRMAILFTLPKWGELIFVLLLNLWNDQDYKKQTLVNAKNKLKVWLRGAGASQF